MAQTVIRGTQILNNTVQRQDLDTSTVGQALVTKIVQGTNVTLSSTGADSGTDFRSWRGSRSSRTSWQQRDDDDRRREFHCAGIGFNDYRQCGGRELDHCGTASLL
jgi:hypothetical protein